MKTNKRKLDNNTPVTVGILNDAVDTILQGMDNMLKNVVRKPDLDKVENRLGKVENRLEKVENEVRWLKDDIKGLKSEISGFPSRKEFNVLKSRVDEYIPS